MWTCPEAQVHGRTNASLLSAANFGAETHRLKTSDGQEDKPVSCHCPEVCYANNNVSPLLKTDIWRVSVILFDFADTNLQTEFSDCWWSSLQAWMLSVIAEDIQLCPLHQTLYINDITPTLQQLQWHQVKYYLPS